MEVVGTCKRGAKVAKKQNSPKRKYEFGCAKLADKIGRNRVYANILYDIPSKLVLLQGLIRIGGGVHTLCKRIMQTNLLSIIAISVLCLSQHGKQFYDII